MRFGFAALLLLASCVRGAPGRVDARSFHYSDESGLTVVTVGAQGTQRVAPAVDVHAGVIADHVVNDPPPKVLPMPPGPGQPSGHYHPGVDVISSASVLANDQPVKTDEWRFEATGGATLTSSLQGAPAQLQALVRASTEPDYKSLSGKLVGTADFFERNTTVSAFLGYGHDAFESLQPPPGEAGLWPATNDRVTFGGSVQQLLSSRMTASAGAALSHQFGTLANPYRRANVRGTLFPERAPNSRLRVTGFLSASFALGGGTALHLRQGVYGDSWGVVALIPEAALAKEVGRTGLVCLRYRLYGQRGTSFYKPIYPDLAPLLSGDPRLGALTEHLGALELRWTPLGRLGWSRALSFNAGYELSVLSYPDLRSVVRAQVFSVGLTWGY